MTCDIPFTGLSYEPSDYDVADGALCVSLNLVPEKGTLRPVFPPRQVRAATAVDGRGQEPVYVHETAEYRHLILRTSDGKGGEEMTWENIPKDDGYGALCTVPSFRSAVSVGNTLILTGGGGMSYLLWNGGGYTFLGDHLPECRLSFGLQGGMVVGGEFVVDNLPEGVRDAALRSEAGAALCERDSAVFTERTLAAVNKMVAEETRKGRFLFPFLLRYAYRLYDGTLTLHSPVQALLPATGTVPLLYWAASDSDANPHKKFTLKPCALSLALDMEFGGVYDAHGDDVRRLWGDVIESVDVFISAPVYTYNQGGVCRTARLRDGKDVYALCRHLNKKKTADTAADEAYAGAYAPRDFNGMVKGTLGLSGDPEFVDVLPVFDDMDGRMGSVSQFYLLKSFRLSSLEEGVRKVVEVDEGYLPSLTSREAMTGEYGTHDSLIPGAAFVYNGRLSLSDLRRRLWKTPLAEQFLPHSGGGTAYTLYFYLNKGGKEMVVRSSGTMRGADLLLPYLFYPDEGAYKVRVEREVTGGDGSGRTEYVELALEKHPFLTGAFFSRLSAPFVGAAALCRGEGVTGVTVAYEPRYNRKLR